MSYQHTKTIVLTVQRVELVRVGVGSNQIRVDAEGRGGDHGSALTFTTHVTDAHLVPIGSQLSVQIHTQARNEQ